MASWINDLQLPRQKKLAQAMAWHTSVHTQPLPSAQLICRISSRGLLVLLPLVTLLGGNRNWYVMFQTGH
jgi:hypothetical protein